MLKISQHTGDLMAPRKTTKHTVPRNMAYLEGRDLCRFFPFLLWRPLALQQTSDSFLHPKKQKQEHILQDAFSLTQGCQSLLFSGYTSQASTGSSPLSFISEDKNLRAVG